MVAARWHTERMRPVVFLFDIDGTLVDAAGAGRRALCSSFARFVGRDDVLDEISFAGMTDPAIVRAGLLVAGVAQDPGLMQAILDDYVQKLPAALEQTPDFRMLDGVAGALEVAGRCGEVGLGTGNVAVGARYKLEPLGLWSRFRFGGYGCDAEERGALLYAGACRGAHRTGTPVGDCQVRVIGDTPHDIAAAHAIGASCMAVATGRFRADALRERGADLVVDALTHPAALEFLGAP